MVNSIEINTLNDETDTTKLFEMNPYPLNISNFAIRFGNYHGINV